MKKIHCMLVLAGKTDMPYYKLRTKRKVANYTTKGHEIHILDSFSVYRQAYYSGIFMGNHVHGTLQVRVCLFESMQIF